MIRFLSQVFNYLIILGAMNGNINYSQYAQHYESISRDIVNQPKPTRACTDVCCVVTFILLIGAFFVMGIVQISAYNALPQAQPGYVGDDFELTDYWIAIAIGGVASLITAFAYVFLIRSFPKVMVYTMMALSLVLLAAVALAGLIFGQIEIAITAGITLLIYGIVLACLWKKVQIGIVLVEISTTFITEKMVVFVTPLIKIILTALFGIFWFYSLNCIIEVMQDKQQKGEDTGMEGGLIALWVVLWLLTVFVFYYMMTFTIAIVCAHWYYRLEGRSAFGTAYRWMFKQFGTLVFSAMILTVVTIARMLAQEGGRNSRNLGVKICMAILRCLLKSIEDLLKVLNHFTIIVTSLTGEGYIEGAKSTIGLLFEELGLLAITNLICNFLVFWGMIVSIGIPCVLGYLYLTTQSLQDQDIGQIIGVIIMISILISTVVYQIMTEATSCIFIFYAMDKTFLQLNLRSQNLFPQKQYMIITNTYESISYPSSKQQTNPYGNTDTSYQKI